MHKNAVALRKNRTVWMGLKRRKTKISKYRTDKSTTIEDVYTEKK